MKQCGNDNTNSSLQKIYKNSLYIEIYIYNEDDGDEEHVGEL